ncbi:YbaB/EbfC family nucleoid-associated protein [Gordonia sihwensis]|uniref:YbaB/EbfC family nucleoid-associated protein n=1 Tax=Gordonia sihwensis TaxID=173559 RepID=UPI0005F07CC6|nr:YbaB/EbfC family nucleoid-associated protein [Gordonia sihwensis]KJR05032.1 nucleoid-associated protein [Gordonia sihwensis]
MTDAFDPSALFGGAGGDNPMAGLMAQVQQMQTQMETAHAEISATSVVGSAGNGLVTVTGDGAGTVSAVEISPEVVDPADIETLQDLIVGAFADFVAQRDALVAEKMGPLAGGGLPGLG